MIYAIYLSAATRLMDEQALLTLLEQCRRNNAELGITGLLLYKGGQFMQVLEGPAPDVQDLLDHVRSDERHRQMQVLHTAPISRRAFGRWAMSFLNVDEVPAADRPAFSRFLDQPHARKTFGQRPHLAHKLLMSFRRHLPEDLGV